MDAARHQVIARALGRALYEKRCLYFHKTSSVKIVAYELDCAVAEDKVLLHTWTPDVEVAVLEAQVFVRLDVAGDLEGQRLGAIQDHYVPGYYFDAAGG